MYPVEIVEAEECKQGDQGGGSWNSPGGFDQGVHGAHDGKWSDSRNTVNFKRISGQVGLAYHCNTIARHMVWLL